jgi:hypothetical protein
MQDCHLRISSRFARLASVAITILSVACLFAQEPAPQLSTSGPEPPPSARIKAQLSGDALRASRAVPAVPEYLWRHGCGPTAVGMVIGYYDTHGFPNLIPGDASTQTADVNQAVASQGSGVVGSGTQKHYEDYSLPNDDGLSVVTPDRSATYPAGCHTDDSIADFMHTSWSSNNLFYGWSSSARIAPAFNSYVAMRDSSLIHSCQQYYMGSTLTWSVVKNEIDNNRPMVFLVDSTGDGATDHFVTIVGYSDLSAPLYACLDTWAPAGDLRWCGFRAMSSSYPWGVWGGWSFSVAAAPTAAADWSLYE